MDYSSFINNQFLSLKIFYYSKEEYMPLHSHDFSAISVVLKGNVLEKINGKAELASTASLLIKPKETLHEDFFGENGASIISLKVFDEHILSDANKSIFDHWNWHHIPNASVLLLKIWAFLLTSRKDKDMIVLLNDFIKTLNKIIKTNKENHPPYWVEQIKPEVVLSYTENLTLKRLAKENRVHPVYLARVFRKYYLCSLKEYVRNLKLYQAVSELPLKNNSLSEIAYNTGFSDQSHFNRVFKSELGISPGALKKSLL